MGSMHIPIPPLPLAAPNPTTPSQPATASSSSVPHAAVASAARDREMSATAATTTAATSTATCIPSSSVSLLPHLDLDRELSLSLSGNMAAPASLSSWHQQLLSQWPNHDGDESLHFHASSATVTMTSPLSPLRPMQPLDMHSYDNPSLSFESSPQLHAHGSDALMVVDRHRHVALRETLSRDPDIAIDRSDSDSARPSRKDLESPSHIGGESTLAYYPHDLSPTDTPRPKKDADHCDNALKALKSIEAPLLASDIDEWPSTLGAPAESLLQLSAPQPTIPLLESRSSALARIRASPIARASTDSSSQAPFLLQPFPFYYNVSSSPKNCLPDDPAQNGAPVARIVWKLPSPFVTDESAVDTNCKCRPHSHASPSIQRHRDRRRERKLIERGKSQQRAQTLRRVLAAVRAGADAEGVAQAACTEEQPDDTDDSNTDFDGDECARNNHAVKRPRIHSDCPSNSSFPNSCPSESDVNPCVVQIDGLVCRCGVSYAHPCGRGTIRKFHSARCQAQHRHTNHKLKHAFNSEAESVASSGRPNGHTGVGTRAVVSSSGVAIPCCCPSVLDLAVSVQVNAAWERLFGWSQSDLLCLASAYGGKRAVDSMLSFGHASEGIFRPFFDMMKSPSTPAEFDVLVLNRWGTRMAARSTIQAMLTNEHNEMIVQTWTPQ